METFINNFRNIVTANIISGRFLKKIQSKDTQIAPVIIRTLVTLTNAKNSFLILSNTLIIYTLEEIQRMT